MRLARVRRICLLRLREWAGWPRVPWRCRVGRSPRGDILVSIHERWRCTGYDSGLDLQIADDRVWLLTIGLSDELCGLGLGSELYEVVLRIAADLDRPSVWQTPSGGTVRGESRADWLLRRGWWPCGNEMHKETGVGLSQNQPA